MRGLRDALARAAVGDGRLAVVSGDAGIGKSTWPPRSPTLPRRRGRRSCGDAPLPVPIATKLAELTGGNPLFVVECARAFKTSGTLGPLPPTIRHVVLDRFEQLPAATRTVLAHGAIVGREFTAARVGKMQGALPARVIDSVLPALRAGLVNELSPGRFAFSHVIVRDVVESSVSAEECARIHALAAAGLGDAGRAVDLARRAIELLEREGAHDRAFGVCERLVEASAVTGSTPLTSSDWMWFARIARAAGRRTERRRLCDRVLGSARAAGDARTFARAALMVGAEIQPAVVDRALVSLLEEARTMLGESDAGLACRVEARLAAALQPHDDFEIPIAMARAAISRAGNLDHAFFQHLNVKTPRWLGFVVLRPEQHSVHHGRGVHAYNYGNFAFMDAIFGTFRNPRTFAQEQGFWDGASSKMGAMLLGRDVSEREVKHDVEMDTVPTS